MPSLAAPASVLAPVHGAALAPPAAAALLLAAFVACEAASRRAPPAPRRRWPLLLLCGAAFATAMELVRFDHGWIDAVRVVGWIGAPIVLIFSASLAGARRWYGWPDLGPLPGRIALASAALLAGVLVGAKVKESDVLETQARGRGITARLRAHASAHDGTLPLHLADVGAVPGTRMGLLAPPAFEYDAAREVLRFAVSSTAGLETRVREPSGAWTPWPSR